MKINQALEELDDIELSINKLKNILSNFIDNIDIINAFASHLNKKNIMYEYSNIQIKELKSLLNRLSHIDNINIQIALAQNRYTPINILKKLSKSRIASIRASISTNSSVPSYILNSLFKDNNKMVRDALAGNSATPIKILDKLAKSRDKMTRMRVAENPSTPPYILKKLINDIDENVVIASKNSLT